MVFSSVDARRCSACDRPAIPLLATSEARPSLAGTLLNPRTTPARAALALGTGQRGPALDSTISDRAAHRAAGDRRAPVAIFMAPGDEWRTQQPTGIVRKRERCKEQRAPRRPSIPDIGAVHDDRNRVPLNVWRAVARRRPRRTADSASRNRSDRITPNARPSNTCSRAPIERRALGGRVFAIWRCLSIRARRHDIDHFRLARHRRSAASLPAASRRNPTRCAPWYQPDCKPSARDALHPTIERSTTLPNSDTMRSACASGASERLRRRAVSDSVGVANCGLPSALHSTD